MMSGATVHLARGSHGFVSKRGTPKTGLPFDHPEPPKTGGISFGVCRLTPKEGQTWTNHSRRPVIPSLRFTWRGLQTSGGPSVVWLWLDHSGRNPTTSASWNLPFYVDWVNYNDLTRPNSPQMVVYVGNSPQTTWFQASEIL